MLALENGSRRSDSCSTGGVWGAIEAKWSMEVK